MTEHVIVPFESFGPIRFGMTVAEVEAIMGPSDSVTHHHYGGFGNVEFADGRVKSAESVSTLVDATVEGVALVGTFSKAVRALVAAGYEVDDPEALTEFVYCPSLNVGLWREWEQEEELYSVTAWARGVDPVAR